MEVDDVLDVLSSSFPAGSVDGAHTAGYVVGRVAAAAAAPGDGSAGKDDGSEYRVGRDHQGFRAPRVSLQHRLS